MDIPERSLDAEAVEVAADAAVGRWKIAPGLVIAWVNGEQSGIVARGVDGDGRPVDAGTLFQIGSITKSFTGLLLADMVGRGELRLDTPLAELRPGLPPEVGAITLGALATHSSGLPRMPLSARTLAGGLFSRGNPYAGLEEEAIWSGLAGASLGPREVAYSNLGVAALGLALGARAGRPYAELLEARVLSPIGMNEGAARTALDCAEEAPAGYSTNLLPAHPWTLGPYAPAGALCASGAAMLRFLEANLDGSAPGAALAHAAHLSEREEETVGLGWFGTRYDEGWITWHNGGTGGFRSYLGFDGARRLGVVVLANSDNSVDRLGASLLGVTRPPRPPERSYAPLGGLAALGAWGLAATLAAGTARGPRITGDLWSSGERLLIVLVMLGAMLHLLDLRGWPAWGLGAGAAGVLSLHLAALWRARAAPPTPRTRLQRLGSALLLALIAWVLALSPYIG